MTTSAATALQELRAAGAAAFARVGLPTRRDEDWRYTSITPIAEREFAPASDRDAAAGGESAARASLAAHTFGGPRVVFVNGRHSPSLSSLEGLADGVRVLTLAEALDRQPELVARLFGRAAHPDRDGFTALNAANAGEGCVVHVAKEMVGETPVEILHLATSELAGMASHPRHLIAVDRHARASVIESFVCAGDGEYFTNAVTEVVVEDGATLTLVRIQRESAQAFHVGTVEARQGRDSHFNAFTFQTGGRLSRSNVYTVLAGEGCGTTINGLYMLDGDQHGDHQTRVEHVAPNCYSREMYKGLLDGTSHGVFNGKVYVHPEAQKTDGKQTNNTLLLSERAQIDTKPQLEIFADDVKCTHGATVGRIDATSLFYLKSRGVGDTLARQLLMYAFAADVLETIEHPPVVERLERLTLQRFTGATHP